MTILSKQGNTLNAGEGELISSTIKSLRLNITELKDNSGLVYIGASITKADLSIFLAQLKTELNADFVKYRQNQSNRDLQKFHLTLINPYEYQNIKSTHHLL